MTEEKEPESDQEIYHAIIAKVAERDKALETLQREVETLKEANKKLAEKTKTEDDRIVGKCSGCQHELTLSESQQPVCPHCRTSSTAIFYEANRQ